MALGTRELYHSSNGDRWHLARDPDTGRVFIRHQANLPSGGHVADIDVGVFLSQGKGPEQQELLRLIGTLVVEIADGQKLVTAPAKRRRRARSGRNRTRQ
jgi:hypothetical protein